MSDEHVPSGLRHALRAAAARHGAQDADPGRLADAAWDRSEALRAERRARRLPRIVTSAAAAVLVSSVAVFATQAAVPAFAVEGDPVQVLENSTWRSARAVRIGAWVHSPAGTRSLRAPDGAIIRPGEGALFRILDEHGTFRVDIRRGDASVDGRTIAIAIAGEVDVAPSLDASAFAVTVSAPRGDGAPPSPDSLFVRVPGDPVVRVTTGTARVFDGLAAKIRLAGSDEALLATRSLGEADLVPLVPWRDEFAAMIVGGASLRDAHEARTGDGIFEFALGGSRRFAADVPCADIGRAAMLLNEATFVRSASIRVALHASADDSDVRTVATHEQDGARTTVRVGRAVAVETPDGAVRRFRDLAAFRAAMPESAALFGDELR